MRPKDQYLQTCKDNADHSSKRFDYRMFKHSIYMKHEAYLLVLNGKHRSTVLNIVLRIINYQWKLEDAEIFLETSGNVGYVMMMSVINVTISVYLFSKR